MFYCIYHRNLLNLMPSGRALSSWCGRLINRLNDGIIRIWRKAFYYRIACYLSIGLISCWSNSLGTGNTNGVIFMFSMLNNGALPCSRNSRYWSLHGGNLYSPGPCANGAGGAVQCSGQGHGSSANGCLAHRRNPAWNWLPWRPSNSENSQNSNRTRYSNVTRLYNFYLR